ncbi:glutathione S-transferase [Jiella pacifica]|uniref:Glutathione S-transferase n=1 Tax=Jiella pacifica TaxID=2696469 RepID=A0A6N9SY16_9HYPH|nr:glutathione S-transferase [Jiella pacifica]NDW02825.1 glutathione S-transferase [Jiella pacifica]
MSDDRVLLVENAINETCPWSGKPIAGDSLTTYNGAVVGFCNPGCRDKFEAATRHFDAAMSDAAMKETQDGRQLPV